MSESSDSELIQQVRERNQQAFLALYDRFSPTVYALLMRILEDTKEAQDVTLDVFLKYWNAAGAFIVERGQFLHWLLTVARNEAIDRRLLRTRHPLFASRVNPDDSRRVLVYNNAITNELGWRFSYFSIRSLPPDQKLVIELTHYHGFDVFAIAKMLDWPEARVKDCLTAGMESLRQGRMINDSVGQNI